MPILPYLQLYRNRILLASTVSVAFALFMLYLTSAQSLTDVGVLWHSFCGCAPATSDVYALLYLPAFTCACVGAIMGFGFGTGMGAAPQGITTPGAAEMRFLFTRPTSRLTILLLPIMLSVAAVVFLPAAALLLLAGWLWLVHAPALGHLVDIARLIPSAAKLGPHPSLFAVIDATHFALFYLSAISIGLCAYGLYYGQRWWVRSPNAWLRIFGALVVIVVPILPAMSFFFKRAVPMAILNLTTMPSRSARPSGIFIFLHFALAAACLLSAWQIARNTEL